MSFSTLILVCATSRKKKRERFIDRFFGGSLFSDVEGMWEGGYSIRVSQTPEGPKVYAKIGKDANEAEIRKQLEQKYPGAEIQIEGGRPLIREISTKPVKSEREQQKENK